MENGMTGGMVIAVHDAREACKGEPDISKRIDKAMRAVKNHWMELDKQNQFRSALAGAIMESGAEDKDRILRSMDALRKVSTMLSALQAGVPVDLEAMAKEPQADDILPLNQMWHDILAA